MTRKSSILPVFARSSDAARFRRYRPPAVWAVLISLSSPFVWSQPAVAEILWRDSAPRVIHQTPIGDDILGGALARDDTASDALYFRLRVDPLSDVADEEYYAAFQLYQGGQERLAVGNAPEAWGYSAFKTSETGPQNKVEGEFNLSSTTPEAAPLGVTKPYELPRHKDPRTIVFKVQYLPDADDLVTVWLEPRLGRGSNDKNQPEAATTKFKANASFDQIHLRHDGGGNGWIFSNMAIATSFSDFVVVRFWQTWWFMASMAGVVLATVAGRIRIAERRKYQRRLQHAEQERAVEHERARIARDLHDDLGSSLARISLLSNLVKMDKNSPQDVEEHANKLAQAADQTVQALEEIVWAVRSGSDSLQGLVDYIAHFANEISEDQTIRCRLDLPSDLPSHPLPPDVRHNIFLVVKEAITNAMRHAAAREILVGAKVDGNKLELLVRDDGCGFAPETAANDSHRNGLRNMKRRAAAIGATLNIQSTPGRGSTVVLNFTFPASG